MLAGLIEGWYESVSQHFIVTFLSLERSNFNCKLCSPSHQHLQEMTPVLLNSQNCSKHSEFSITLSFCPLFTTGSYMNIHSAKPVRKLLMHVRHVRDEWSQTWKIRNSLLSFLMKNRNCCYKTFKALRIPPHAAPLWLQEMQPAETQWGHMHVLRQAMRLSHWGSLPQTSTCSLEMPESSSESVNEIFYKG